VIAVCPALHDYAHSLVPDATRLFLLENSLFEPIRLRASPADTGAASALELPVGRRIVAYAGTFESYQGVDLLIDAFADVQRARSDALLLLIGGTPAQVAAARKRIDRLGLARDCMLTGTVPKAVAQGALSRAAVIVSPRVSGDNTPLKVYELLACGVPFVATRIHSHTQVLSDDVCFLVEPQPHALASGILCALDDRAAAERTVAAARELYRSRYSRATYVATLQRALERLG
jgi:glycosyltransferase involved in cell wall biosynthesis